MTALAVYFFNIPGAMMRVLNCFTRRGLLIQGVWCAPADDRHRALVVVEAAPITIEQIVRELESTVGVNQVEQLEKPAGDLANLHPPVVTTQNGSTVITVPGPPEEHRALLSLLGSATS